MKLLGVAVPALALALALGACADDDGDGRSPTPPKPLPGGRFESPDLTFEAAAVRPLRLRTRWLVSVRMRLKNRTEAPLEIGRLTAVIEDRRGRAYKPIQADGKNVSAPVFADGVVPPGKTATSTARYRVRLRRLIGADLQVRDRERALRFELSLF